TIFVGPNASGKSSVLQGLDFLCKLYRDQEGSLDVALSQAASRGSADMVELAAQFGGKGYRYRCPLPYPPANPQFLVQFGMAPGQSWSGFGRGVALNLQSANWQHWV